MRRFMVLAIAACFTLIADGADANQPLPARFHGVWASDLARCSADGESTPLTVGPRLIIGYEYGWEIRRWTHRNGVWIGRGRQVDDQGSQPAKIRLSMNRSGRLRLDGSAEGLVRCPPKPRPPR